MGENNEIKQSKIFIKLFIFFFILKPQDATIRSSFFTLFFKVIQYLCILGKPL